jgi:esterase/lipase superfamily enzyme
MGKSRPRFVLFASQDDSALTFSKSIWGGVERIGAIDPAQEPYQSELGHEHVEVFDLTKLKGSAHDRAFEDITEVMVMVKHRIGERPDQALYIVRRKFSAYNFMAPYFGYALTNFYGERRETKICPHQLSD